METEIKSPEYYKFRISFVARQYLEGKMDYKTIKENKDKLVSLLDDAVLASNDIKNNLSFQLVNDLVNKKMGTTEQQDINLMNYARGVLKSCVKRNLSSLEEKLNKMEHRLLGQEKYFRQQLEWSNNNYQEAIKNYKSTYGVEFPTIQKKYESLLPRINNYLEEEN